MVNEPELILIGHQADFHTAEGQDAPEWEHGVLLRDPGCKALAVDTLRSSGTNRMLRNRFFDLGQMRAIGRSVRASTFVLAQSEQSGYEALPAFVLFSRKRLNIIFHGHRWWSSRNRLLAKVANWKGVRFLCLSESLGTLLKQELGIKPEYVHVTGYGVDADFFQPTPGSGEPCVVSAGTASRDYKTLIAASVGLAVPVKIAADSTWYRETLNIEGMAVPDSVQVFSSGSYRELRKLYSSALFVVVPLLDVRYACGYAVIAEAMAMGKAVIVTRTSAPSDLVEHGVTGLYVPPGDTAALREAMRDLLSDPELALRMGRAARAAVEERFNLRAYVRRVKGAMGMPEA